jgi:hypothetical protein
MAFLFLFIHPQFLNGKKALKKGVPLRNRIKG